MMADSWNLTGTRTEQIGLDWLIIGYPRKKSYVPEFLDINVEELG